jgi:N-acetylmuramoyl-L-alanine amidase
MRFSSVIAALLLLACAVCAAPTIVIDAGHGGHDRGGMPGQRIPEKSYALDVAKRLEGVLRSAGVRTVMTRKGDYFVTLGERCRIGNAQSKAVFNGAPNTDANGIETYYYRGRDSSILADRILRKVSSSTGSPVRFSRSRPLYVLRNSRNTAVLCELGFLTNGTEAKRIGTSAYRQTLAQAIGAAIIARYR